MPGHNPAQQQVPGRSQYWHPSHAHPTSQAGLQQQQLQQQMRDSGRGVGAGLMVGSPPHQPLHMGSAAGPPTGLAQTQNRLPPTQAQPPQSMFAGSHSQRPLEQGAQNALQDRRTGMQPGITPGATANGHTQLPVGSPLPAAHHLMGVPQPSGMQQMQPHQQQQQQNKRARQAPPLQTLESLDPQRDEMTQFAYQLMQQQQQEQQQQQPKPVTPLLDPCSA